MIVYPAIDLKEGKCVRLTQGDFISGKIYNDNPELMLHEFAAHGASWVHIVDLDGAQQGAIAQLDLISKLVRSSALKIQVGGGIRTADDIEKLFSCGVKRVIVGSVCVAQPDMVKLWLDNFGEDRIVLALDCSVGVDGIPIVKTHGWQNDSNITVWDLLKLYDNAKYVLCTDINVDGMLTGSNIRLYQELQQRFPNVNVIASGGVGKLNDLTELRRLNVHGVVVGKAIYEGKIALDEIFNSKIDV